jgi:hypothetical protein
MSRPLKQLLFGLFYLILWVGFGLALYFIYFKPAPTCFDNKQNQKETGIDCGGPCIACELKGLQPEIISTRFLPAGSQSIILLAEARNPSQNYDLRLRYRFEVSGRLGTFSVADETVLPAGATRYLIFPNFSLPASETKSINLKTVEFEWLPARPSPSLGGFRVENIDKRIVVRGEVVNNLTVPFNNVRLGGLLFDKNNDLISASTVKIGRLNVVSSKEFSLFFPPLGSQAAKIDPSKTQVFIEVIE